MKAVVCTGPSRFEDRTLADPQPGERDLLVEVHAVSVNPVDTKVCRGMPAQGGTPRVLGWDAAGIVRSVGTKVTGFAVGDRVWYAGSIDRPGSNAELQLVDERIVGHMPATLGFAEAAAMPLTAITAWEMLFDRLQVQHADPAAGQSLLVIGAAGGVGSVLVQLARQLTGLTVIGTAARSETRDWVMRLGAHHVIDHSQPLDVGLQALGLPNAAYVACLSHTDQHVEELPRIVAPQGALGFIEESEKLTMLPFMGKACSLHWELMFARPVHGTSDMDRQGKLLSEVARLVDVGTVHTTMTRNLGAISAAALTEAHRIVESGSMRGKLVLAGW